MSRKITKFGLNLTPPPTNFFGGAPKILKPVLGNPFQGLFPGKVWTTPLTLRGGKKFCPQNFFGGSPQNFETSFGYSFSWPIRRISLDHVLQLWFTTLGGLGPPNFNGGSPPKFWTQFLKLHLYPTISDPLVKEKKGRKRKKLQ